MYSTILVKQVYWYISRVSGERLQDHWSSGLMLFIKSSIFSLIRLCDNVVYRVEKSYVDKLVARNPLHFNLLSTSPELFIDQNQFLFESFIYRLTVSYDMRFDSSKAGS